MNDEQITEFNQLSREIPIPGYEGYRAIHPEIYKSLLEKEKNISHLEGMQEGLNRGQEIVNDIINKI